MKKICKFLGYISIVILSLNSSSFAMDKTARKTLIMPVCTQYADEMLNLRDLLYHAYKHTPKINDFEEFLFSRLNGCDIEFLSKFQKYMNKNFINVNVRFPEMIPDLKINSYIGQLIERKKAILYFGILAKTRKC